MTTCTGLLFNRCARFYKKKVGNGGGGEESATYTYNFNLGALSSAFVTLESHMQPINAGRSWMVSIVKGGIMPSFYFSSIAFTKCKDEAEPSSWKPGATLCRYRACIPDTRTRACMLCCGASFYKAFSALLQRRAPSTPSVWQSS